METEHLKFGTQTKEQLGKMYNVDVSALGFYERPEAWDKWSKPSTSKLGPDMMEDEQTKETMVEKQLRGGVGVVDDLHQPKNSSEANGNETRYVSKQEHDWSESETTYMALEMGMKSNNANSQQFNLANSNAIDWYLAQSETQPATLQMNDFDDDDLRTIHGTGGGGREQEKEKEKEKVDGTAAKKLDKSLEDDIVIPVSPQVDRTGGCSSAISAGTSSHLRNSAVRPSGKTWVSPFPSRTENLYFFMFRYKVYPCPYRRNCPEKVICELYHHDGERRRNPGSGPHFLYSEEACQQVKPVGSSKWLPQSRCANGDKCQYSHTILEQMYHPNIYKTSMCMNYNNPSGNRCKWGYYCTHAHGQDDVRTPVNRRCNAVDADGFGHVVKDTTLKTHARVLGHHSSKELIRSNAMNIKVVNDDNIGNNGNAVLSMNSNNNTINAINAINAINNNNNNSKSTITIPMNRLTNVTGRRNHEHGHNDMVIYPVVMDKFGPMTSSMQPYASYSGDTHKFTSKVNANAANTAMNTMDVPLTYSHYPLWSSAVALPVSSSSSSSSSLVVRPPPHHQPMASKNNFVTTDMHAKVNMPVMPDLDSAEPAFLEYLFRPAAQGGGIGLSDTDFETDDQDLDLDLFPLNISLPSPSPSLPMWEDVNPLQPLYPLSTVSDVKSSAVPPQPHLQAHALQSSQLQKHKQKRTCDLCGLVPLSVMQFIPCNHVLCASCSSKDMKCSLCLSNTSSFTHL